MPYDRVKAASLTSYLLKFRGTLFQHWPDAFQLLPITQILCHPAESQSSKPPSHGYTTLTQMNTSQKTTVITKRTVVTV